MILFYKTIWSICSIREFQHLCLHLSLKLCTWFNRKLDDPWRYHLTILVFKLHYVQHSKHQSRLTNCTDLQVTFQTDPLPSANPTLLSQPDRNPTDFQSWIPAESQQWSTVSRNMNVLLNKHLLTYHFQVIPYPYPKWRTSLTTPSTLFDSTCPNRECMSSSKVIIWILSLSSIES